MTVLCIEIRSTNPPAIARKYYRKENRTCLRFTYSQIVGLDAVDDQDNAFHCHIIRTCPINFIASKIHGGGSTTLKRRALLRCCLGGPVLLYNIYAWGNNNATKNAFPCPLCLSGGGGTAVQASQKLCCCFGNEAKPTESDGLEVGVEADFVLRWLHQSFTCIGRWNSLRSKIKRKIMSVCYFDLSTTGGLNHPHHRGVEIISIGACCSSPNVEDFEVFLQPPYFLHPRAGLEMFLNWLRQANCMFLVRFSFLVKYLSKTVQPFTGCP